MDELRQKTSQAWQTKFLSFAGRCLGEQAGKQLWQKYQDQLRPDYQALISPRYAFNDLQHAELLSESKAESVSLLKPDANHPYYRLHFYSLINHYLDEFIPLLENLGLRVIDHVQFSFLLPSGKVTIRSFSIEGPAGMSLTLGQLKAPLLQIIRALMSGQVENDGLNQLCVLTGLTWQEIDLLRTYRNYYLQIGQRTTTASFHHALVNNPAVALGLFKYFDARFNPNPQWNAPLIREERALFPLRMQLSADIDSVSDLNDDRILRTLFNLIDATVRSNFHIRRTRDEFFIAIKINSLGVIDMPSPRPYCEIYVHANDMEGIHLRGGKVARGGIRWSDRIDDFRTEILGLMQTQVNKNAMIIPTGAKGGFVVKSKNVRASLQEAGKQAYLKLIRGLLELTDNYRDGAIVNPAGMVCHDDPDPYLVVAADKGTAKFSDIANRVSAEYGFWLADAFASGGSRGYDHKALGITAKGAWKCINRHFLELGKDIQNEDFSVVGVGSMDGDVFGNGMLLSPHIRLLAAFSGQHIFIDPNPQNLAAAFAERQRLFLLPNSSWNDYDRNLISSGGGVYSRTAKDIPVSPELKQWLGIRYNTIDGETLIRCLLVAPVELLWLGGIGTYVKASSEKHEEANDRSNDNVRVDACDLQAKVVGEGANLGFTQKGRIEYDLLGGRINTDAVDNSAGVDTSDHEVNLKILLAILQKKQLVADYQKFFIEMTDAVCQLVLADNIAQSLCLSLEQLRSAENSALFLKAADRLEAAGYLDRTVEAFAQNKEINARPGQRITRPELADLMAAGKRFLSQQLQNTIGFLQKASFDSFLQKYFPDQLVKQYKSHLGNHPLASEIKATVISNLIINQAGCGILGLHVTEENGNLLTFMACYLAYDRILQAGSLRTALTSPGTGIPVATQYQFLTKLEQKLIQFCCWSITHENVIHPDDATVDKYCRYLQDYEDHIRHRQPDSLLLLTEQYQHERIPLPLAQKLAFLDQLDEFPFIVALLTDTGEQTASIFEISEGIDQEFGLRQIRQALSNVPISNDWERKLLLYLQDDLQNFTARMLKKILMSQATGADYLRNHSDAGAIRNFQAMQRDINNSQSPGLLAYVCLIRSLSQLAEG